MTSAQTLLILSDGQTVIAAACGVTISAGTLRNELKRMGYVWKRTLYRENVPLKDDIQTYFGRDVLPFVPDAWIDHGKTIKGYEINFNRYFYKPKELRTLE